MPEIETVPKQWGRKRVFWPKWLLLDREKTLREVAYKLQLARRRAPDYPGSPEI